MNQPPSSFERVCQTLDICNRAIDDSVITDRIKNTCPPGAYSWLQVRSMNHQFTTVPTQNAAPSRMVEFQPCNLEATWNILSIIFQKTEIETLSLNRLGLGILGSKDPKDQAEVRSAFWQNYSIKLFVATDGTYNYDISIEQGKATEAAVSYLGKHKKPEQTSPQGAEAAPQGPGAGPQGAEAAPQSSAWCVVL